MTRLLKLIKILLIALFVSMFIYMIGFLKYKVWRAEHPNAETWTFWISKN